MLTEAEKEFLNPDLDKLAEPAGMDPFDLLRIHRAERDEADELGVRLAELLTNKKGSKRTGETAEDIFFKRQKLLCHIAHRFHPLCRYGISVLEDIVLQRKSYEKKAGRMICSIDRGSSKNFAAVMSEDIREDVDVGKYRAVGILSRNGDQAHGVGSLVYYYEKSVPDGIRLLRIVWLYVHPDYRNRGCADVLVSEILHTAVKNRAEMITADIQAGEALESLGAVLDKWFFRFTPGMDSDFVCRISDIANLRKLKDYIGKAKRLSAHPEPEVKRIVNRYFRGRQRSAYIIADSLPGNYIDTQLSFYTGSLSNPGAMILAHQKPSGIISVEYSYVSPLSENDSGILFANFTAAAAIKYGRNAQLRMSIESENDGDIMDNMFPKQMGFYMAEAVLKKPDWDAGDEDIEAAMLLIDKKDALNK